MFYLVLLPRTPATHLLHSAVLQKVLDGAIPLDKRHLQMLTWLAHLPCLRRLPDPAPALVDYVAPSCFDRVSGELTRAFTNPHATLKDCRAVFIDGASGCGKTRMGWELYQKLKNSAPEGAVQYAPIYFNFGSATLPFPSVRRSLAEVPMQKQPKMCWLPCFCAAPTLSARQRRAIN